ncbi:MAG: type II toxin-antitoxin system HicA family toxin [Spirosomataceae bacterium]
MDLSARRLIKILEENGFLLKRTRGSHHIFYHPESQLTVPVPVHGKDLKKGTFLGILKEAGIDKNQI